MFFVLCYFDDAHDGILLETDWLRGDLLLSPDQALLPLKAKAVFSDVCGCKTAGDERSLSIIIFIL